ncbi:MAG: DUF4159 domain-containing protein [Gemmatimonadota bacterium]|uniref:DUF4159 domain-containing protein n=1 Tax=marine metagenome TaxID=408172 RepID=A0A382AR23_9ZZZZ|nr:DUF4159 domain-containing protein [Gemmatimonadota bacterium]
MKGVVVTLTLLLTSLATVAAVSATGSTEKAVANKGIVWRLASDSLLTITRLQYEGGGDWYANPSSLPNLLLAIRMRTGLSVSSQPQTVRPLDPSLKDHPYLYMTGHGNVRFSPEERLALREHLIAGGFLHADDNYGMDESFRKELREIFPDYEFVELPPDHAVFSTLYEFPDGLPKIHEHDGEAPQAFGIFHGGRLMVFYSYESDLGDGWENADVHGDEPELREASLRMGINLYLYVLSQLVP